MTDDLDDLIRGAMKTLDEQVPSGYFEALPNQTLARLEGSSMQHGSSGTTDTNARDAMVPPPVDAVVQAKQTDEDSGLHDIRNLAQSTKQRLSSRRITNSPVGNEDDILASASGSFRNIALPQPAAMVSLPELAELPSKQEVIAADKKAQKAAKAEKKVAAHAIEEAATSAVPTREAFSLPSQQNKKSKAPLFALVGLGVAAAAGGVIYMQTQKSAQKSAPAVASIESKQAVAAEKPPAPQPTVAPIEPPQKTEEELKAEAELEKAKADALAAEQAAAAANAEQKVEAPKVAAFTKTAPPSKKGKAADVKVEKKTETTKPADKKEVMKPDGTKASGGGGEGEPSFDALLKEAGVDEKHDKKPVLEKKSLTADDFKKGMAAITEKAQACYSGTQGTATVKLTIAPNGSVSKVTVGGAFAGKPEAACVSAAVKGASFPAWDGGPQSFTYAYMLSD